MTKRKDNRNKEIVYREVSRRVWGSPLISALTIALAVGLVIWTIIRNQWLDIVFISVFLLLIVILMLLNRVTIEIASDALRIKAGIRRFSMDRARITSCEPYEMYYKNSWGFLFYWTTLLPARDTFHLRKGMTPTVVNPRTGMGVKLRYRQESGDDTTHIIATDSPEEISLILSNP